MIENYQRDFIAFLIKNEALRFGEFTLKSGRKSPYFINTGQFNSGKALNQLSACYAAAISNHKKDDATIIFGPAYKGIPLCVGIAAHFARESNADVSYLFDRKEAKGHGEFSGDQLQKQFFVGRIPVAGDRVLLVDDVLTTGGTKYEAVELLRKLGDNFDITGLAISVNRQERDAEGNDPVSEFQRKTGIPVFSIITVSDIIEFLEDGPENLRHHLAAIRDYRERYGVATPQLAE